MISRLTCGLYTAAVWVFGGECWAAVSTNIAGTNAPFPSLSTAPVPLFEILFKLIGSLFIVFGIILAGAWLFRRSKFGLLGGKRGHLQIIESKPLGPRQALHVVRYGEQRFLIADSPTGVRFLTPLETPEESATAETVPAPNSFAEKLKALLKQKS
ncbi:MAG: hypothetical protein EXS24_03100 [Pedosphaera sp.]|nr:hypothetical protein [Pedosphaera sp.]